MIRGTITTMSRLTLFVLPVLLCSTVLADDWQHSSFHLSTTHLLNNLDEDGILRLPAMSTSNSPKLIKTVRLAEPDSDDSSILFDVRWDRVHVGDFALIVTKEWDSFVRYRERLDVIDRWVFSYDLLDEPSEREHQPAFDIVAPRPQPRGVD